MKKKTKFELLCDEIQGYLDRIKTNRQQINKMTGNNVTAEVLEKTFTELQGQALKIANMHEDHEWVIKPNKVVK